MKGILSYLSNKATERRYYKADLRLSKWWKRDVCHYDNKKPPEFAQVGPCIWSEVKTAQKELEKGHVCPKETSTKARIILRRAGFGKELDAWKR